MSAGVSSCCDDSGFAGRTGLTGERGSGGGGGGGGGVSGLSSSSGSSSRSCWAIKPITAGVRASGSRPIRAGEMNPEEVCNKFPGIY